MRKACSDWNWSSYRIKFLRNSDIDISKNDISSSIFKTENLQRIDSVNVSKTLQFLFDYVTKKGLEWDSILQSDTYGRNALHYSVLNHSSELFNLIITYFCKNSKTCELEKNWFDFDTNSPLYYSIVMDDIEVVNSIISSDNSSNFLSNFILI